MKTTLLPPSIIQLSNSGQHYFIYAHETSLHSKTKTTCANSTNCYLGKLEVELETVTFMQHYMCTHRDKREYLQSKGWGELWLSHTWGIISMLIKARELDHNKSLCKQWLGNRVACSLCSCIWCWTPQDNHNLFDKSGKRHTASVDCYNWCPIEYTTYNICHEHLITISVWQH